MTKPAGIIESLTQRIENLEQLVEDQARELEQLRAEVAWRDGKQTELKPLFTYEEIKEFAETIKKKANDVIKEGFSSQQQRRDEIIIRAKSDVAELLSYPTLVMRITDSGTKVAREKCRFIVNEEKRTVVALMVETDTNKVGRKGIAKCHPDDCFNVHIGKAIALRRALDLEVPDEYLNAPQPAEVTAD